MRAKHREQARARCLRQQGHSLKEIADELGVAKSSVSLWVRDLPRPTSERHLERARRASEARWRPERARRERDRAAVSREAAAMIGTLGERELLVAGVLLYWAEGTKSKPHARRERITLINSDPDVIRFFLRWLEHVGVSPSALSFRISIHESADLDAARCFWADVVGVPPAELRPPTLKRHNPATVRKNTGEAYRGCLIVDVRRSAHLYRRVEGWWYGIVGAATRPSGPSAVV